MMAFFSYKIKGGCIDIEKIWPSHLYILNQIGWLAVGIVFQKRGSWFRLFELHWVYDWLAKYGGPLQFLTSQQMSHSVSNAVLWFCKDLNTAKMSEG